MGEATTLRTADVLKLARIPYTTLDYWVREGLVSPSAQSSSPAARKPRKWTFDDVLRVRALRELHDAGCPVRLLKVAKMRLDNDWHRSLSAHLLFWKDDILVADDWGDVMSLIREPGQVAMRMVALPLGPYLSQIQAEYVELEAERALKKAALQEQTNAVKRIRKNKTA